MAGLNFKWENNNNFPQTTENSVGHSMFLFCRGRLRNVPRFNIQMDNSSPVRLINLFFGAVVCFVCLRSLINIEESVASCMIFPFFFFGGWGVGGGGGEL